MKELLELLKLFFDKHLIPALISIVAAILGVTLMPGFLGIQNVVGKIGYGVFVFGVTFLIVELCFWSVCVLKRKIALRKSNDEIYKKQEKENVEKLWDFVDSLSPQDKKYLRNFLETNNKPIEISGDFLWNSLFNNNAIMACTDKPYDENDETIPEMEMNGRKVYVNNKMMFSTYSTPTKLYRLKDDFFELLKYSQEKYHKISHFDSDKENEE